MDLRAALSRLLASLSGKGRPQEHPPTEQKMRRPGRDYEDKMLRPGKIQGKPLKDRL
jgi:hypothetical protein